MASPALSSASDFLGGAVMSKRPKLTLVASDFDFEPSQEQPVGEYPLIPCRDCPEFEAFIYPCTPDSAEEYDEFCHAGMGDDVFLRYMEGQNDEDDTCPYYELHKEAEWLAEKCAQMDFFRGVSENTRTKEEWRKAAEEAVKDGKA